MWKKNSLEKIDPLTNIGTFVTMVYLEKKI